MQANVLDPAKRVVHLTFRTDDAGGSYCGECGAVISGSESGTKSLGVVDDSSADVRDWRTLGQSYMVFWPCGHYALIGGLVPMGFPGD